MDGVRRGKMGRGEREETIRRDLKGRGMVPIKDLIRRHPKASVYYVLKRLKEREEGRYVKVERSGKMVATFQLIERKAPHEEVMMSIQLLSGITEEKKAEVGEQVAKFLQENPDVVNSPDVKREAAKDLMALASKYEIIPGKAIDFLLDNWHRPSYAEVQEPLFTTLLIIAKMAKAKGFHKVVDKVKRTADKALEIAKDFRAPPRLRLCAWGLLILLEERRIRDVAYELLAREEEQEGVMAYVRGEIKRHADENPLDAKRRLYNMLLRTKEESSTHQRILCLLQAIRYPSMPMEVPKMGRYAVVDRKGKGERARVHT